ncbi:hypothetical protein AB0I50_31265, partial [Streptomyces prunicolor]
MAAAPVWSVDPRTGKQREQVAVEATAQEVDTAVRAAHAARGSLADRTVRAAFLRGAADPSQTIRQLGIRLKLNPLKEVIKGKRLVV